MNEPGLTAIHAEDVMGRAVGSAPPTERVEESVLEILQNNKLCSIATVTPEGRPHINTAFFSYTDKLELYFLSHPASEHCRNLSHNSSMAMTVFSTAQQWADPGRGVQLFGVCEQAVGPFVQEAERSYAGRFRAYASWKSMLGHDDLMREYRFYRFRVVAMKILDEKRLGDALFVRAAVRRD